MCEEGYSGRDCSISDKPETCTCAQSCVQGCLKRCQKVHASAGAKAGHECYDKCSNNCIPQCIAGKVPKFEDDAEPSSAFPDMAGARFA